MDKRLRNQFIKLQTCLEDAVQLLREMTAEIEESPLPDKVQPVEQTDALLNELKQLSRDQAKKQLESMKKKQIEPLFRQLGGSSSEARKTKEYVIDRILWRLFDFSREHDILLKG